MNRVEIGKRIKKLREARGISKCKLASEAGVSPSYIPDIESGKKCPTVEVLESICDVLGITIKDFFNVSSEYEEYTFKFSTLSTSQRQLLISFLNSL